MIGTRASIDFLMSCYAKTEDYVYEEDFLESSPFGHFINAETSKEEVMRLVKQSARKRFGRDIVQKRGQKHQLAYSLRCKINFEDGRWISSWRSTEFTTLQDIRHYPTGSKICFRRSSLHTGRFQDCYIHTGLILHMDDDTFVAEVQKVNRYPRLTLTRFLDMDPLIVGSGIFVDNSYMVGSNLDLRDVLYRLSRIVNCPIQYDFVRLNCDIVSTFLTTGRVKWTTLSCVCNNMIARNPGIHFQLPFMPKSCLTEIDLMEIEASSPKLKQREVKHKDNQVFDSRR